MGQAVGLHGANFRHLALVEIDQHAAATLALNVRENPAWKWEREHCLIVNRDVNTFKPLEEVPSPSRKGKKGNSGKRGEEGDFLKPGELDLLAGGVPCPRSRTPESSSGVMMNVTSSRKCWISLISSGRER